MIFFVGATDMLKPRAAPMIVLALGLFSLSVRADEPDRGDVSMTLMNLEAPFVTSKLASHLGALIVSEKYPGAAAAPGGPLIEDGGDLWRVTIRIARWIEPPISGSPLAPKQLTISIRKKDAAVLSVGSR
jgi:hypothetical protein